MEFPYPSKGILPHKSDLFDNIFGTRRLLCEPFAHRGKVYELDAQMVLELMSAIVETEPVLAQGLLHVERRLSEGVFAALTMQRLPWRRNRRSRTDEQLRVLRRDAPHRLPAGKGRQTFGGAGELGERAFHSPVRRFEGEVAPEPGVEPGGGFARHDMQQAVA